MGAQTRRLLLGIAVGVVLGIVAGWIAVGFMAGGHGTYLPASLLFPFSMILAVALKRISTLAILLALFQYPVYLAVGFSRLQRVKAWLALAFSHIAGAGLAYVLVSRSETFR
jgi:hypothetical protein